MLPPLTQYTPPMPDLQPTPATPDELAAIFLRARDVPCPACGYNRRDGTTAVCPECDRFLKLMPPSHDVAPAVGVTAITMAVIIALAALALGIASAPLAMAYSSGWPEFVSLSAAFAAICSAVFGVNRAVLAQTSKEQRYIAHHMIATSAAAVLCLVSVGLILPAYEF